MQTLAFSPRQSYTQLHARITEEDGAFTVSVRLPNHLKQEAWRQEIAVGHLR